MKPRLKVLGQSFHAYAEARFKESVGHRQSLFEGAHAGEVAHEALIQPVEWAQATLAIFLDFHTELAGEHVTQYRRGKVYTELFAVGGLNNEYFPSS